MSCIDLEKLNLDILDINRPIIIPIRTPYSLELKSSVSCPPSSIDLYSEAQANGNRMGGIILDNTASMICDIEDNIICDMLKAYNITIQNSQCGISQGSYNCLYVDNSTLTTSSIIADVACCNSTTNNTTIDRSTFKIGSSINILNGTSIKESTVIGNNFLTILSKLTRIRTIINDSTININKYSFLDRIEARESNFNLNAAISYDSQFQNCTLNLTVDTPLEPSGYLLSFLDHVTVLINETLYQDITCNDYTYDDDDLLIGCSDLSSENSAMQDELDKIMLERESNLEELRDSETKRNKFKQSAELLDNTTKMIEWVSGQPFRFSEEDPITIGQILKACTFDNTRINTSNTLILNECTIKNSSGIINANQILSRELNLSPTFSNPTTIIDHFLFDEESNTYSTYKTISQIGNSSLDFEKINYGTTTLSNNSHITTEKWFGEVTIESDCSIACDDFFSEYCDIKDNGRLILNSKNIMLKNLGINTLLKEATLEIPDGTLYITPNYTRNNSSSMYHNAIPDLQGTITGTSIGIHQPRNAASTSGIFKNATIHCDSLYIDARRTMNFHTIASFEEIEITRGTIYIKNLGENQQPAGPSIYANGNIIAKNCELTISGILLPTPNDFASYEEFRLNQYPISLEATNCTFANKFSSKIIDARFSNSELTAGWLDRPFLSGSIQSTPITGYTTLISEPTIEDHISYQGVDDSSLRGATFPEPIYDASGQIISASSLSFSHDNKIRQPPSIGNIIVPSGNIFISQQKLIIDNGSNGLSDIASMRCDEVEILNGRTIFSHGKIDKIFVPTPSNLPDPEDIIGRISLIELNNMNISYGSPLIVSKPIYYLRDFIIKNNSKVALDVNENHFIYVNLENKSILDGKSKGFSHCSFIFNVDSSRVKNLDLNLHYSMMANSGFFENCTLNFEPLTPLNKLNSSDYISYRNQLEELDIPDYYYHMAHTSLQNCSITGTQGTSEFDTHLMMDDCDFSDVTLNTPPQFIYSFTNNHFWRNSFKPQNGSTFPNGTVVNLDKCYWKNINWSIDNTKITFTSMIDDTELARPTVQIFNKSRADFVSTDNVGLISGDLTSNIALYGCRNLETGKIYGQIYAAQFINSNSGIIYTNHTSLKDSSINDGTIYVTGIPSYLKTENFVNNNLIDIADSGNFIQTTNEADGNLIASSGTITLKDSVNNGNIDCEKLIIINSTNNGTINCQDLTWTTSINNSTSVYYQNAISVDDSLTYPNS